MGILREDSYITSPEVSSVNKSLYCLIQRFPHLLNHAALFCKTVVYCFKPTTSWLKTSIKSYLSQFLGVRNLGVTWLGSFGLEPFMWPPPSKGFTGSIFRWFIHMASRLVLAVGRRVQFFISRTSLQDHLSVFMTKQSASPTRTL